MEKKSYCRYCRRRIRWVQSPLGRWVPVEPGTYNLLPTDSGPVTALNEKGQVLVGKLMKRASKKTVKVSLPHRSFCRANVESGKEKAATSG